MNKVLPHSGDDCASPPNADDHASSLGARGSDAGSSGGEDSPPPPLSPPPPPLPPASDKRAMIISRAGLRDQLDALDDQPSHVLRAYIVECEALLAARGEAGAPGSDGGAVAGSGDTGAGACVDADGAALAAAARDADEPLLREAPGKYVNFPVDPVYAEAVVMYKQHVAAFWTPEELDLSSDVVDWTTPGKMSEAEKSYTKKVLAFFAASDGIVCENLVGRFSDEVQVTEVRQFYGFQIAMEGIHGETYSLLIDTLVADPAERNRLFNAIDTMPCIAKKARWALDWIGGANATRTFAERLVAFAVVEGIFFSSAFCAIYWLRKRNLLEGVCKANELIARDEGLHCEFAAYLYTQHIVHKLTRERVLAIVTKAVEHECEFVRDALPENLLGINAVSVQQYVRFVADYTLRLLGQEPHYGVENPFDWMHTIGMSGKSNFFEQRVTEYQRPGVMEQARSMVRAMDARGDLSDASRERLRAMLSASSSSPASSRAASLASSSSAVGARGAATAVAAQQLSGTLDAVAAAVQHCGEDGDIDF